MRSEEGYVGRRTVGIEDGEREAGEEMVEQCEGEGGRRGDG